MILLIIALILSLLSLSVFWSIRRLDKQYRIIRVAYLNRSLADVWHVISDFSSYDKWGSYLKASERLPYLVGRERWKETDHKGNVVVWETVEVFPLHRFIRRIVDEKVSYNITWSVEIREVGEVTLLSVCEEGQIDNRIMRFIAKYLSNNSENMDQYINSVGSKLGVNLEILDC